MVTRETLEQTLKKYQYKETDKSLVKALNDIEACSRDEEKLAKLKKETDDKYNKLAVKNSNDDSNIEQLIKDYNLLNRKQQAIGALEKISFFPREPDIIIGESMLQSYKIYIVYCALRGFSGELDTFDCLVGEIVEKVAGLNNGLEKQNILKNIFLQYWDTNFEAMCHILNVEKRARHLQAILKKVGVNTNDLIGFLKIFCSNDLQEFIHTDAFLEDEFLEDLESNLKVIRWARSDQHGKKQRGITVRSLGSILEEAISNKINMFRATSSEPVVVFKVDTILSNEDKNACLYKKYSEFMLKQEQFYKQVILANLEQPFNQEDINILKEFAVSIVEEELTESEGSQRSNFNSIKQFNVLNEKLLFLKSRREESYNRLMKLPIYTVNGALEKTFEELYQKALNGCLATFQYEVARMLYELGALHKEQVRLEDSDTKYWKIRHTLTFSPTMGALVEVGESSRVLATLESASLIENDRISNLPDSLLKEVAQGPTLMLEPTMTTSSEQVATAPKIVESFDISESITAAVTLESFPTTQEEPSLNLSGNSSTIMLPLLFSTNTNRADSKRGHDALVIENTQKKRCCTIL